MKIIKVSNYDDSRVDDVLISENVKVEDAEALAEHLNKENKDSDYFYRAVENSYVLYKFQP